MRHLIAPLFVASIILLAGLGFWRAPAWALLVGELGLYFVAATTFGAHAALKARAGLLVLLLMPFVFFAIHLSWGGNFLLGLVRQPR
jgi:hypothetical protein